MQERDYATPTKWKRKRGGFKYSTKITLARSRMGKRLSKVDEGEAFLTSRTILFKTRDEDTYTDRLSSTPYIGGEPIHKELRTPKKLLEPRMKGKLNIQEK